MIINQLRSCEEVELRDELSPREQAETIKATIRRVEIHSREVIIEWKEDTLLSGKNSDTLRIPIELKRRGKERMIVRPNHESPGPRLDRALVKALICAYTCREALESGMAKSTKDLVKLTGKSERYV